MTGTVEFESGQDFADRMDAQDPLARFRDQFYIPKGTKRAEQLYFTGNSLGLQPKAAEKYLEQELEDWKNLGVEGHFHGKNPWFYYHHFFKTLAGIVGAKEHEVVVMNNLTVNLHLLFASFYRPEGKRYKVMMEAGAFPSDMYVVESQVKHHGYDYEDAVIEISPREGEHNLRTDDILQAIQEHGDELALVFFSGVQYYTGQAFDMPAITQAAHQVGAIAGFDLAHAAGNLKLDLHNWNVDFAAWCSYKYMNSGPGGVSGVYIHEKHGLDPKTPRFAGWWGHKEDERFLMQKGYRPEPGAAGWQLSNAPVMTMAVHWASLDIFKEAGMDMLVEKGKKLNAYLEYVVKRAQELNPKLSFTIIYTGRARLSVSMLTNENGKALFDYLMGNDVITDWREPNVIRMAPVPLYNSFRDIYDFGILLSSF